MAKEMGTKYVKITTKHHEGFCLWPSKYTKYTVANTPYKRDILGELVKAYNDEGIDVHFYFSVMDWSNPDYRYDIKSKEDSIAFSRFLEFTDNQLKELAHVTRPLRTSGLMVRGMPALKRMVGGRLMQSKC